MLAESGEWLETIISISLTHSVIGSSIPDCGPEVSVCPRTVLPPHSAPWSSQQGAPDTDLWISR